MPSASFPGSNTNPAALNPSDPAYHPTLPRTSEFYQPLSFRDLVTYRNEGPFANMQDAHNYADSQGFIYGTDGASNFRFAQPRPPVAPVGPQLGGTRSIGGEGFMDLLQSLMNGGGVPHIPGGSVQAGHATASHATATHAIASLIDMLDVAYQPEPNANLREDIYSRLSSGANAAAAGQIRGINDQARLAGTGPNAPWVAALSAQANRNAASSATQGLTDFFDQYVTAALARRAGALDTNARLGTGVSQFNAGADNDVSMFNAGANNQISMFNAGAAQSASAANAGLNQQAAYMSGQLGGQSRGDLIQMLEWMLTPRQEGGSASQVLPQTPFDWGPIIQALGGQGVNLIRNANGGSGSGDTSGGVLDSDI